MGRINRFALIIGAMKSGTTALFQYLAQHPEICPCRIKEPNFFAKEHEFNKGFDHYENLWDWDPEFNRVALEASTGYTSRFTHDNINTVSRIASSPVPVKLIYIMRHPMHRIESQLRMNRAKGWKTFDENGNVHRDIVFLSCYFAQISEYLKRFPREDILLLRFEDYIQAPSITLSKVCDFLEVDQKFRFSISSDRVHDGTIYALQSSPVLAAAIDIFPKDLRNNLFQIIPDGLKRITLKVLHNFSGKAIELTAYKKNNILNYIKEDMKRLKDELHFDTRPWGL